MHDPDGLEIVLLWIGEKVPPPGHQHGSTGTTERQTAFAAPT